jgi:hypothetical protein
VSRAKSGNLLISRTEFDSVCEQLKVCTHEFIGAWATQEDAPEAFGEALVKLHAARLNLESAVEAQAVAGQPEVLS